MLRRLPPESEYATDYRDSLTPEERAERATRDQDAANKHGPWSRAEMLLARIGDGVDTVAFLSSDGKGKRPEPLARPGVGDPAPVTPINARSRAFLEYIREHHGAAPPPEWEPTAN